MNRDNGYEKPLVITRKKVGKGSTPAGPTKTTPRAPSPAPKAAMPAPGPKPPAQPLPPPPAAAPPQQPEASAQPAAIGEAERRAEKEHRRGKEKQASWELLQVLQQRWPATFPRDFREVRPWAIGISGDLAKHFPEIPFRRVHGAIRLYRHLATIAYCRGILRGGPRYDLEVNPCGEVTAEDQERARQDLKAFYERRKQQVARRPAPPADTASAPVAELDTNKM
jgi:ProP effector